MNHLYTFLALDIARERAAEAAEVRRARAIAVAPTEARPNALRRSLALGLAAVSRSSAEAARRLDDGAIAPAR